MLEVKVERDGPVCFPSKGMVERSIVASMETEFLKLLSIRMEVLEFQILSVVMRSIRSYQKLNGISGTALLLNKNQKMER